MHLAMKIENLRELEAFREIIQFGSVTAAARSLELGQPAVSRLLARLESRLAFRLFHRRKGKLVPTAQALALFEEVELALQGLERVKALASDIHRANTGELRVVAPPSFAEGPLVKPLAAFLARHPNVRVMIDSRTRPTVMNLVASHAADCGFGKLPIDHPEIHTRPLVDNPTVCVLPPEHPLARGRGPLGPAALAGEPLIMVGLRGSDTRLQLRNAFREAGVQPDVRLEAHNVGAACALAAAGVGIAIVNELLARNSLWTGVRLRRFQPLVTQSYVFMSSARVREAPLVEAFYEHCRQALRTRTRGST